MGELIDGLLALSRLGREKVVFGDVNISELARTAFEEQGGTAGRERDIVFKLEELPPAHGDKRLITQVLQNLFSPTRSNLPVTNRRPSLKSVGAPGTLKTSTTFATTASASIWTMHRSCSEFFSDFMLPTSLKEPESDSPRFNALFIGTAERSGQKPSRTEARPSTSRFPSANNAKPGEHLWLRAVFSGGPRV